MEALLHSWWLYVSSAVIAVVLLAKAEAVKQLVSTLLKNLREKFFGETASTPLKSESKAATKLENSEIADSTQVTGSGNSVLNRNSYNKINLTLPFVPSGAPGRERYDEWCVLRDEMHEALIQVGHVFSRTTLSPGIIDVNPEPDDYQEGIKRGDRIIRTRLYAASALKREKILEKYHELVKYAVSSLTPQPPYVAGRATKNGFEIKASAFEDELMEIAQQDINHPSSSSAQPVPVKVERPEPNIVYAGSEQRRVYLGRWDFQGIADPAAVGERKVAIPALLLRFENKVLSDRKIGRANSVIAKMRFLRPVGNSTSERAVDYGIWLNAKSNSTGMDAGDTSELVLMCFVNDKLLSFRDKRNGNRNFGTESFSYFTQVDVSDFDRVEVTIIDQNSQSHLTATLKYWYGDEAFFISEA
jgi:hypothetical protein